MANYDGDAESHDLPWALTRPSSKSQHKSDLQRNMNPKYRVDQLNEAPPRLPGIRSLLPLPGGDLLTGGTDLKIRRWDHCRFLFEFFPPLILWQFCCLIDDVGIYHYSPDRSYCVSGPNVKGAGNDSFCEAKSSFGVQVVQVCLLRRKLFCPDNL